MLKKMFEFGWFLCVLHLGFSFAMAQFLVQVAGWRYTDLLGIHTQPFDASDSILAFFLFGGVIWPLFGLVIWLAASEVSRKWSRRQRRLLARARTEELV